MHSPVVPGIFELVANIAEFAAQRIRITEWRAVSSLFILGSASMDLAIVDLIS